MRNLHMNLLKFAWKKKQNKTQNHFLRIDKLKSFIRAMTQNDKSFLPIQMGEKKMRNIGLNVRVTFNSH